MASAGIGQALIERYLHARGYKRFRADDGECLVTVACEVGAFRLYLRTRGSAGDVVKVRARSSARFPRAERARLLELVNRLNDRTQWLTASVRDVSDGSQLRVVGNSRLWVAETTDLETFSRFVDMAMGAAARLFEAVDAEMKLPSPDELRRWFEWTG